MKTLNLFLVLTSLVSVSAFARVESLRRETTIRDEVPAGGLVRDADTVKEMGGVGNYLFRGKNARKAVKEQATAEPVRTYEDASTEVNTTQSAAVMPTPESEEKFHFRTGSSKLTAAQRHEIQDMAVELKRNSTKRVEIEGYADSTGSEAANQRLSARRAKEVAKLLMKNGVRDEQIAWAGKGESNPVANNRTKSGRAKNRRVEAVETH